jgi:hypothetical protein
MLIAPFQVKIGAPAEPRVEFDHCRMAYSRVKPYVKDIFFSKKIPFATPWTGKISGHKFNDGPDKPRIRTLYFNDAGNVFAKILSENSLVATFTINRGNWDTPGALARNTPVWSTFEHAPNTIFAPRWHPAHLFDSG